MNRSQRVLGAAIVAMVATAAPSGVNGAIDTRVQLDYKADEQGGCVGEDQLRRMVTDQLGHDPFRSDADQRVAIDIAKTEAGFQGRILWTDGEGRRVGERLVVSRSRDCREIVANVAFAVALQLQLVERGGTNGANTAGATPEQPPATATDQTNREPEIPERPAVSGQGDASAGDARPNPVLLAVGVGPAVGIGMTPDPTLFGRLFVVARRGGLSAEIAADAALPATQREWDGSGAVVNAMGSSAAGCAHVSFASACALGRLGWIRARGMGVASPRTSWGRFGEVGMRVAATRELGRFMVSVHADGLVMLSRWNVVLSDAVLWSVPRVGVGVGVDVALRFF